MAQSITSAGTDLNQIPAIFRLINATVSFPEAYWAQTHDVLDFGGGRGDKFSDLLASLGVRNYVFDPFNRSEEHNALVERLLKARPADLAVCSNVLNVIKEPSVRREALKTIKSLTSPEANVFFTVYEGKHKDSRGRKTTKGWQANRPTKSYIREIRKEFGTVALLNGKLIVARDPK
jgi:methyltransferase family protein